MVEETTNNAELTPLTKDLFKKSRLTKQLFKWWMERPLSIYRVFQHMYGIENVDMNGRNYYKLFTHKLWEESLSTIIAITHNTSVPILDFYTTTISTINTLETYEALVEYILSCEDKQLKITTHTEWYDYEIIVHFPKLTITNENDNSIDITHLWVSVAMNALGRLSSDIRMNRSEYTSAQYKAEYRHSHLPRLYREKPYLFDKFCFGNGPITHTIDKLISEYDLTAWQLFCVELQTCLQVESLAGGPYIRISEITDNKTEVSVASFVQGLHYADLPGTISKNSGVMSLINYRDFIKYLIKSKVLKLLCRTCAFTIGENYFHYITNVSKVFIDWYNKRYQERKENLSLEELVNRDILCPYLFKNGILYKIKSERANVTLPAPNTIEILKFKGKAVYLNVIKEPLPENYNVSYLLSYDVAIRILITILQVLNYRYDSAAISPLVTLGEPGVKVKYLCPV